jgi:hypothetical protein
MIWWSSGGGAAPFCRGAARKKIRFLGIYPQEEGGDERIKE